MKQARLIMKPKLMIFCGFNFVIATPIKISKTQLIMKALINRPAVSAERPILMPKDTVRVKMTNVWKSIKNLARKIFGLSLKKVVNFIFSAVMSGFGELRSG